MVVPVTGTIPDSTLSPFQVRQKFAGLHGLGDTFCGSGTCTSTIQTKLYRLLPNCDSAAIPPERQRVPVERASTDGTCLAIRSFTASPGGAIFRDHPRPELTCPKAETSSPPSPMEHSR